MSSLPKHTHSEIEERFDRLERFLTERFERIDQQFEDQRRYIDKSLERLLEDIEGKLTKSD